MSESHEHIRVALTVLAEKRRATAIATTVMNTAYAKFEADHAGVIDAVGQAKKEEDLAEQIARELVEAHFRATGEAKPHAGAWIVMKTIYAIDEVKALDWARETKMALVPESVDIKAIAKIAGVTPLPFVTANEIPSVRIASDLDAKLVDVPAAAPAEVANV